MQTLKKATGLHLIKNTVSNSSTDSLPDVYPRSTQQDTGTQ